MKVRDLFEQLKGKEDYDLTIDCYEIESVDINNEDKNVDLITDNEDGEEDNDFDEDEDYEEPELEEYLQGFDIDDLVLLAKKLNVNCEDFDDIFDEELIEKILELDEAEIKDICEDLFDFSYEDFKDDYEINNAWIHSNYENKDIDDYSVDDHLAAWYDHMMEK